MIWMSRALVCRGQSRLESFALDPKLYLHSMARYSYASRQIPAWIAENVMEYRDAAGWSSRSSPRSGLV